MKKLLLFTALTSVCSLLIYGQGSPGGVDGGGTNELWLNANAMSLNTYNKVSSFTDMSGNGNHAVQATASNRPFFINNDGNFNGNNSISFDGVNDVLKISAISSLNTNTQTVFLVADGFNNSLATLFRSSYSSGGGTASESAYFMGHSKTSTDYVFQIKRSDGSNIKSLTPVPGGRFIMESIWDGLTSFRTYNRGIVLDNLIGSDANPTGHLGISLGANFVNDYPPFKGWIAEVIVYSKALNSAERIIVENYLGAKYKLAIANDFYAYDPTYYQQLIGIGQNGSATSSTAFGENLTISNPSTLGSGDYILVAHDGAGYQPNFVDVPNGQGSRYEQVWRADSYGTPGTVTIEMDVSVNTLGTDTSLYSLLVDANGVFSSGAVDYPGVYANGVVTFSNVTLPKGHYFTLSNGSINNIQSTGVTTDWHLTTTWNCSCIPNLNSNVNILNGHTVEVNTQDAEALDLTIDGTLNLNSADTLFLNGDLTNNNTLSTGVATVYMIKSATQTISGISGIDFYNLYLNSTDSVINSVALTVSNKLYLITGTFETGNNVRLLSNASNTAYFFNERFSVLSGDLTVERFLNEGESYYLLGSAVTDGDLEDWNQEFEMSGPLNSEWPQGPPSVYYYDQNNNVSDFNDGFTPATNTLDLIDEKTGWTIYVGDDSYATGARTIDMTGVPRYGNVDYTAPHLANIGVVADDGWSLFANPYAAPVRWGDVEKTGAFDEAQYKKADGSNDVMDSNFVLAPGEGFWVHANPGGASLRFRRTHIDADASDDYNLRISNQFINETPQFKILLNQDDITDECIVGFNDNATNEKEPILDAYKLPNANMSVTNVSTLMGTNRLLKNIMNSDVDIVLPIKTYAGISQGVMKNYKLSLTNIDEVLNYNKSIVIEDKVLNTFTPVLSDYETTFSMLDSEESPRFYLHIKSPIVFNSENITCNGSQNGKASASLKSKLVSHNFIWTDENGKILKTEIGEASKIENLTAGNYLLEVDGVKQKFTISEPEDIDLLFSVSYGGINYGDYSLSDNTDTLNVNLGEKIMFSCKNEVEKDLLWDFGDLTTSMKNNTEHLYFNEGVYKVQLIDTENNCNKSFYKYINVSGKTHNENNHLNEVDVYNINEEVFIKFNNKFSKNFTVEIYSSLGQQVVNSLVVRADINHVEKVVLNNAAGVYLVTINDGDSTKSEKIVITKE